MTLSDIVALLGVILIVVAVLVLLGVGVGVAWQPALIVGIILLVVSAFVPGSRWR